MFYKKLELNKAILNFFEKLGERLFLRLVDESTRKIKRNNRRTKPLREFLNTLKKSLSTESTHYVESQ